VDLRVFSPVATIAHPGQCAGLVPVSGTEDGTEVAQTNAVMKFRSTLAALLLMALPAWAAGQLDALRSSAKLAREQAGLVRSEQMQKRQQLNEVSTRIEALKAKAKGKLLPGSELDAALKQSQELSGVLTGLAQTMSTRESELESANLALLDALNQQLTALRADFDRQNDRPRRKQILSQFRSLRAEREQVRAGLPAAKLPALESIKFSDDPSELLEQADAVRDDEDKVRRELKVLEGRIDEAKAERDLNGRVRQFLGEESLFDDQDRRLRVRRETTRPESLSTGGGVNSPKSEADPAITRQTAGEAPAGSKGLNFGFGAADNSLAPRAAGGPPEAPSSPNETAPNGSTTKVTSGTDARPALGQRVAGGDDEDLEELEVQRLKLQSLATQLRSRAGELEKKAAELK
jgi:hypothetical protein